MRMSLIFSLQGVDQLALVRIGFRKSGVQVQDGPEQRHGDAGYDNGFDVRAQPYNEKRSQGGFGQAVQNDQIRLQDFGNSASVP